MGAFVKNLRTPLGLALLSLWATSANAQAWSYGASGAASSAAVVLPASATGPGYQFGVRCLDHRLDVYISRPNPKPNEIVQVRYSLDGGPFVSSTWSSLVGGIGLSAGSANQFAQLLENGLQLIMEIPGEAAPAQRITISLEGARNSIVRVRSNCGELPPIAMAVPSSRPEDSSRPPPPPPARVAFVTNPTWTARPTSHDIYPPAALRESREGSASMRCVITSSGGVTNCNLVAEDPPGLGVGNALLNAAPQFRLNPTMRDGASAVGAGVNVSFQFVRPV